MRWMLLPLLSLALLAAPPRAAEDEELARFDARIKPEHRRHWAFQPVREPALPAVKDAAWVRTPVDRFILAGLERKGWKPACRASPQALLRRVHLDLVGLPPTIAEQEA